MRPIEAEKIRALSNELSQARYQWEQDRLRTELDSIANEVRFEGSFVIGDDGADSDEGWQILKNFGITTVADIFSMSRDRLGRPLPNPEPPTHIDGMRMLGLSSKERQRIATTLENGRLPIDVLNAVVTQQELIQGLHTDKYPFNPSAFDVIHNGLARAGIDCEQIWQGVERNLLKRGRDDLALMYGYDSPETALTIMLEHYALTKYDIKALDRTRREVHF